MWPRYAARGVRHLVPLLLQVAAVHAHHAAHGQAERLPRLQHLDVEEGGGGEQAVPQRRQLVAQPDQVPHHHQLERLLLPLVGLVRYVPAERCTRDRRAGDQPWWRSGVTLGPHGPCDGESRVVAEARRCSPRRKATVGGVARANHSPVL